MTNQLSRGRVLRNPPRSSGKVEVRGGMACGDPSLGRETSAPCKSPVRRLICTQEQLVCNRGIGLMCSGICFLEKGGCLSERLPGLAGASVTLQLSLLVQVDSSSFFCDMSQWGCGCWMNLALSQSGCIAAINLPFLFLEASSLHSLSLYLPSFNACAFESSSQCPVFWIDMMGTGKESIMKKCNHAPKY